MPDQVEPTSPHPWDVRLGTPQYPLPTYTPSADSENVGELYRYPPGGALAIHSQPLVTPGLDESSFPVQKSLPLAFCTTLFLNVPAYYSDSAASHAWGAKAIEYAIGAGCVGTLASLLLVVERRCGAAGTLLGWRLIAKPGRVEAGFVLAFTVALFPCAPRLGYAIAALSWESLTWKTFVVPAQVFLAAVPTLVVVMAMFRLMSPSQAVVTDPTSVVIVREDSYAV